MRRNLLSSLLAPCLAILGLSLGAGPSHGAPERFTAAFASGARIEGDEIRPWHETKAQPKLKDKALFDPTDPVEWVRDNTLAPGPPPGAFVEFAGGDRFPGRVIAHRSPGEARYPALPPHLLVEPASSVEWPEGPRLSAVRVSTSWLRRIVWERRGIAHQSSSLFFRDGRRLGFRSVRWNERSVVLLLEEGTLEVPFGQIAELHFPRADPWQAYVDQLVFLGADASTTLSVLETVEGLRATTSNARFQARCRGPEDNPQSWIHRIQPAWSLDPICVRHRSVYMRRFFRPEEPPASLIEISGFRRKPLLSGGWGWEADRNVQGGPLRSGGLDHGWGLGVHAHAEIEYEVPPIVRKFRTRVGLDEVAGRGGCARAAVLSVRGAGSRALFESPPLVGSAQVADTGWLDLEPGRLVGEPGRLAGESGKLVLVADPAVEGRPPGADPLDIRDAVDWIEPRFRLDPDLLLEEALRGAARWIPAWESWACEGAESVPIDIESGWSQVDAAWRLQVSPFLPFLKLSRRASIDKDGQWLVISLTRAPGSDSQSRIRVLVDGASVEEGDVPEESSRAGPDPLLVPLESFRGREVLVDIIQVPEGTRPHIRWRALGFAATPPGLEAIFEDEMPPDQAPLQGSSPAVASGDDKKSGASSVKVEPAGQPTPIATAAELPIRAEPRLGEYRFLRFAWKKKGGGGICLEIGHDGRYGPSQDFASRSFRYVAGKPEAVPGLEVSKEAPGEWSVVTRDLHQDFGDFRWTGLAFQAIGGESALLDQVYLARTPQDFEILDRQAEKSRK